MVDGASTKLEIVASSQETAYPQSELELRMMAPVGRLYNRQRFVTMAGPVLRV
jgi:hypothetical protein